VSKTRPGVSAALLVVHTAALLVALYLWIPMYRRLASGPGGDHPGAGVVPKVLVLVIIMQACYWGRRRLLAPPPPARSEALLGHVLLFLSRLAFVFVGSTVSIFIVRAGDTQASPGGMLVAIWFLFAIFCYVLELEALARPRLERTHA
jgi:hypothetical protein